MGARKYSFAAPAAECIGNGVQPVCLVGPCQHLEPLSFLADCSMQWVVQYAAGGWEGINDSDSHPNYKYTDCFVLGIAAHPLVLCPPATPLLSCAAVDGA